jgi:hypothetical protein
VVADFAAGGLGELTPLLGGATWGLLRGRSGCGNVPDASRAVQPHGAAPMATYEYVPETGTFVNTATDATTPVSAIGAGDTVDFPNIEPGTYDYTLPSNFTAASIHIGLGARIKVAPGGTLTAVVDISTGGHLLLNGQGTPVTFNGYAVGSPLATGLGTLGMVTINITADISSNILARIAQTITTNNRIYINTSVQVNVSSTVQNTGATLNLSDAP